MTPKTRRVQGYKRKSKLAKPLTTKQTVLTLPCLPLVLSPSSMALIWTFPGRNGKTQSHKIRKNKTK